PVRMTVKVSQNSSGVSNPGVMMSLLYDCRILAGFLSYTRARRPALRADFHIAARRIFDRRQRIGAHAARRHLLGIDRAEPSAPARPPRALVHLGTLDPVAERDVLDIVVGPVLVLAAGRWIDHARDVAGAREHILHRAAEELRAVEHGIGRCNVIFAGGEVID